MGGSSPRIHVTDLRISPAFFSQSAMEFQSLPPEALQLLEELPT